MLSQINKFEHPSPLSFHDTTLSGSHCLLTILSLFCPCLYPPWKLGFYSWSFFFCALYLAIGNLIHSDDLALVYMVMSPRSLSLTSVYPQADPYFQQPTIHLHPDILKLNMYYPASRFLILCLNEWHCHLPSCPSLKFPAFLFCVQIIVNLLQKMPISSDILESRSSSLLVWTLPTMYYMFSLLSASPASNPVYLHKLFPELLF